MGTRQPARGRPHQRPASRVVVNVTTDKCYENREWDWGYRENEPMGGHDPYSSRKGCAELVTAAYRRSFFADPDGPRLASARAGNVIGGGDWGEDRLVPDVMRAVLAGEPVRVRNPQRDPPLAARARPAERLPGAGRRRCGRTRRAADGWNFGPADEEAQPVGGLVERLAELWPERVRWTVDDGPHPHEAHYLKLDSSKARAPPRLAPAGLARRRPGRDRRLVPRVRVRRRHARR